ncbi:carbon-nitrogen hydrolase family protein [Pararhizobium mangrovi]|uniref:Carbon-nitrogen hydrolase family protein n=1 Tax=Pararhizobium mangrovi TaxID=2590452 RepID=A0A506U4A0_9HYPH|nr:carbon-nitrogen hydrolase family protein [Pararhizobium mangrovi]TPW28650.1 carbon-nitrogen hydrolase family protein [Pararhizobium mangrovi]
MGVFTAAAVQMRAGTDPARNIEALRSGVVEAAGQGARYVQTPEMTGALQRDRTALFAMLKAEADDPVVAAASALAQEHGIHLHIGSTPIAVENGRIANRALLFGPDGSLLARYDKMHMFDVDLDGGESWRESSVYQPGADVVIADTDLAAIGIAICYDIRFPELFRRQAVAGAQVLTAPSAFTRQTGEAHWHVLQRARAIENGAFVIAAAQGGKHEDGRETYGHSLIVDPWGRILAEADHDEPAVIVAEIDTEAVAGVRGRVPNLANARPLGHVRRHPDGLQTVDDAAGGAAS